MNKHNLSAFEENILRAFNDTHTPFTTRTIITEKRVNDTFDLLVNRGQLPNPLRIDYIKKVLEHFVEIGVIS